MKQHIITALVNNHSGVLTRISGLFARRGFNIDSLSVCATAEPSYSRMTIISTSDGAEISQIIKQLDKLVDVIKVTELKTDACVARELLLVKINLLPSQRPEIESTCNMYKAKTVDVSPESMILELTGEPNKLDAFIGVVRGYGIIELIRTGLTALERGKTSINDLFDYNELV